MTRLEREKVILIFEHQSCLQFQKESMKAIPVGIVPGIFFPMLID